jgi:hypothetical protein
MPSRAARLARGLLAGGFATLTATVSHGLAAGHAPSTLSVALAGVFAVLVSTALVGRRRSAWRLAASVTVSQLAFHGAFVFLSPAPGRFAGVHQHGGPAPLPAPLAPSAHEADATMWAAHALGAVLTFLVLRYAEAAFACLREIAAAVVRRIVGAVVPVAPRTSAAVPASDLPRFSLRPRACVLFRGPPVAL